MAFTDEDLRRLKESIEGHKESMFISCFEIQDMKDLLARLEAAEKVCFSDPKNDLEYLSAKHCWRKSAGKS